MEAPQATPLDQQIRALLSEEPSGLLRDLLTRAEPVEIADALYHFAIAEQQMLLGVMNPAQAANVLVELDEPTQQNLLRQLTDERVASFIELMEPDDGADTLELLDLERQGPVLARVPAAMRGRLTVVLAYGPDTAGGLMDPDVVQVRVSQTVAEAVAEVRRYVEQVHLDDFFAVFVVDAQRRLVGVVPNWKMLLAEPDESIEAIMLPDPISVDAHLDQEAVSRLVWDHDLVTLPVVDGHRRLIGRITVDDVVDVIQEEHHEDIGRLSGTGAEEVREISLVQSLRDRAPWLMIALVGQMLAATIMHVREDFLISLPQLAFFIPAIMAMGGNTGIQSASLVIRGLATGEIRLSHFWRRLGREFAVSVCIGVVFALLLTGGSVLLTGHPGLGVAVGLATLVTIALASTGGAVIPFVLQALKLDPALATGPFLTTVNDVLGILVYLSIAYMILL